MYKNKCERPLSVDRWQIALEELGGQTGAEARQAGAHGLAGVLADAQHAGGRVRELSRIWDEGVAPAAGPAGATGATVTPCQFVKSGGVMRHVTHSCV